MFKLKHSLLLFFYPPDAPIGGNDNNNTPSGGEMGHEEMIEFLADDGEQEIIPLEDKDKTSPKGKNKTTPKDKEKEKSSSEDDEITDEEEETTPNETEDDELAEIEAELEEPDDEKLELVTPVRRRDILKKYPQLFKDFPYLEKAYYREQQFTEVFPTINDAKAAHEKSEVLDKFENDVMGGNIETILKSVKETNPGSFHKIVDNYLTTLSKIDEPAYMHVLSNVTKHTIVTMVNEARRLGVGEGQPGLALQQAAHLLNQFVFGTSDFKPPTRLSREDNPDDNSREKKLSEREQTFVRQQFEGARNELNTRVNNTLRNTIDANIDPKGSMTDYVKRNASRDTLDTLENLINQDSRFKVLVDKLWEKAFESNFSRESLDRIRSAYTSKAKTLLPSVIKKARIEALKGMGKRVNDSEEEIISSKKGPVTPGRPRSQNSSGKVTKASEIPTGMSTLEFLNSE